MPIKKIEIHGLNPAHPIATVIDEINANLDSVIDHINGIDAETGVVGPTGAKGDKGDPGQQGIEGPAGKDGKDGQNGQDGTNGTDGATGAQGLQGIQGEPGKDGKDGLPGADGAKGETGAQGIQGLPGKDGTNGAAGLPGAQGLKGDTGSAGAQGIQGVKGDTGTVGATGPAGVQGLKGDTGAMGPVGAPGAMNTATYTGPVVNITGSGQTIGTYTFTSNGYPVMCIANGDGNPINGGSNWVQVQWFRDGVAIGNKFHLENNQSLNPSYCITALDTPTAGAHIYSLRSVGTTYNGAWGFGEAAGPQFTFIEMTGAVGPAGKDAVSGTNLNVNYLTVAAQGGDEGGEILLNKPVTNTSIAGTGVIIDVYQNKLRILETGGTSRGAYLDLTTAGAGVGTNLNRGFASGYVNAGTFVTLDNLKFSVTTGGGRGLSCATVSGTVALSISGSYAMAAGNGGSATAWPQPVYTTTPSGSWFGWSFPNAGDASTYLVNDTVNQRFYRVHLMIGYAYNNNFISIERLG